MPRRPASRGSARYQRMRRITACAGRGRPPRAQARTRRTRSPAGVGTSRSARPRPTARSAQTACPGPRRRSPHVRTSRKARREVHPPSRSLRRSVYAGPSTPIRLADPAASSVARTGRARRGDRAAHVNNFPDKPVTFSAGTRLSPMNSTAAGHPHRPRPAVRCEHSEAPAAGPPPSTRGRRFACPRDTARAR